MIVTFYSYKGGVGRSMAVANVAELLADSDFKVIVCDWDLEAPGLESYFAKSKEIAKEWKARPGVMDLIEEYKMNLSTPPQKNEKSEAVACSDNFKTVGKLHLRRPW